VEAPHRLDLRFVFRFPFSGFRFRFPVPVSVSGFRFRFPFPVSVSGFRFRFPFPVSVFPASEQREKETDPSVTNPKPQTPSCLTPPWGVA
jgi:hypothetical protein